MPAWEELRPLIERCRGPVQPASVAQIDRYGASLRDRLDELGLSVRHEETLYALLALLDAEFDTFLTVHERGGMGEDELITACSILSIVGRALVPHVPAGAL